MINKSSPFKWKYEKLLDQEEPETSDHQQEDNSSVNGGDDGEKSHHNNEAKDLAQGRELLQSQLDEETIIFDLEYSKDFYELKKRSQDNKKNGVGGKNDVNHYIFHKIEKNDTLQGIALKWHCSLNELKRVNSLVSDQDFYGLNVIKIPVKKYGILSEVMVHQLNSNLTLLDEDQPQEVASPSAPLVINVGLRKTFQCDDDAQDMNKFLSNLDKDLEKMRKVADSYAEESGSQLAQQQLELLGQLEQQQQVKVQQSAKNLASNSPKSAYQCDGADCGLNWFSLLLIALLILVLVPVIYAFGASKVHPT